MADSSQDDKQQTREHVQLEAARQQVRRVEVEALRTHNELKAALMSVNELTHEVCIVLLCFLPSFSFLRHACAL